MGLLAWCADVGLTSKCRQPRRGVLLGIKSIVVEHPATLEERGGARNVHVANLRVSRSPVTLIEHMRKRRLELGLSQNELGEILKVAGLTVSRWELGKAAVRTSHRRAIIAWLGCDSEEKSPANC